MYGFQAFYWDTNHPRNKLLKRAVVTLADGVNRWLRQGDAHLALQPAQNDSRWELGIQYGENTFVGFLYSAIALQLALTVGGADSLYVCSSCCLPYIREVNDKDPGQGRDNFCEDCRRSGAPLKFADKRRRERMAAARTLADQGLEPAEIAATIGARPQSVLRWI